MTVIFGIKLNDRVQVSTEFQQILTKYGCNIKTRVGLHPVEGDMCSVYGIVLLELIGSLQDIEALECELKTLGLEVQKMNFN